MYLDSILFVVGGGLLLLAAALGVFLAVSRKRSREYRRILEEENERTDVLETLRQTQTQGRTEGAARTEGTETEGLRSGGGEGTEPLYGGAEGLRSGGGEGTEPLYGGAEGLRSGGGERTVPLCGDAEALRSGGGEGSEPRPADTGAGTGTEPLSSRTGAAAGGGAEGGPGSAETRTELVDTALPDTGTMAINIATAPAREGVGKGLDLSPLAGKYDLLTEIHGGGMSRIFLAKHRKLGSEWIVKYVDGGHAELADEAEVLKKLNHISLPQIIDIFQGRQGTFLVERYIEGYTLEQVLKQGQKIRAGLVIDWGVQLAQVLHYLHHLETPIIHCDLKPSNIMVTHDNRLVLIDFGISKRQGISEKQVGLTLRYAAPEQFRGEAAAGKTARYRFGELPPEHAGWEIDERTDLYSAGVILYELVMQGVPSRETVQAIRENTSAGLAAVVCKCLELDPARRWQSAKELSEALEGLKTQQLTMARSLVKRRILAACGVLSLLAGLGVSASGAYVNQVETKAVISMEPGEVVVTEQQGVPLLIQKTTAGGRSTLLEPSQLQWTYADSSIARMDGGRLVGLNVGETTLEGVYRSKKVTLHITVTEPVKELVSTALRYTDGGAVSVYAGSGARDVADGTLGDGSFVSPKKITADGDSFYLSDSGLLRVLEDGEVYSVYLEPEYLTADIVWSYGPAFYILTGPWEDEDGSYYGFLEITDDGAEFLYVTEAEWSVITDFAFSSDGLLWFIQQNLGTGVTSLYTLDVETLEQSWVTDLPESARSLVFDGADNLYISVPEDGTILRIEQGARDWAYFAGVSGERNFIDGEVPNFYRPTSLALDGDSLYVFDFDTVRRVKIDGASASMTETIAGVPIADTNPQVVLGEGHRAALPASELASIAVNESGTLLLTDPKNSVIYEIKGGSLQ